MAFSFNELCSNLIPNGDYKVKVSDVHFKIGGTGETSGDIVVKYTILEGSHAKKTYSETISNKAFSFKLLPFLKACGVDTAKEFATLEELYNFGLKAATGKSLMITMGSRTYNGQKYNSITNYAPVTGSTTSTADVLKAFGDTPLLKTEPTVILTAEKSAEVPTATEPSLNLNISDDLSDDELPF